MVPNNASAKWASRRCLCRAAVLFAVIVLPSALSAAERPVVESQRLRLVMRADLNGPAELVDRQTGRDYAADVDRPQGLYRITLGEGGKDRVTLSSVEASKRGVAKTVGGVELQFEHKAPHPVVVTCRVTASANDPLLRWRIHVDNQTKQPVTAIEFPILTCPVQLGDSPADDAVAYPHMEGVLLAKPAVNLKSGQGMGDSYPGSLSAQFMYFFDHAGGLYVAALDSEGHPKSLLVNRRGDTLSLAARHSFPSEVSREVDVTYDVVCGAGAGRWEAGAELYREWAAGQPWCARTIAAADSPDWLSEPIVFLNYSVVGHAADKYGTVNAADRNLKEYHDLLGVPVVACAFGWERHGTWIGPDYFPPRPNEAYYEELSQRLAARGDRMHVFTSGFRWGVKKPVKEDRSKSKPRVYTDYDGNADFQQRGRLAAVVNVDGKLDFREVPWADNYSLCAGSEQARQILTDAFCRVYAWGVAGIDLDQNLGAGCSSCWSKEHGHPPGSGQWKHEAMSEFLRSLRQQARRVNSASFIGVEEPCEAYIPWIDIYHGRAFTDTAWPASGPSTVSIPLYIYLYHEHQPGYAGWIDTGFSPMRNVRFGLARAFLFGMQLGVRIHGQPFDLTAGPPTAEMQMLAQAVNVIKQADAYLLKGRMLPTPDVSGSPMIAMASATAAKSQHGRGRPPLPMEWPVVQATAWRSAAGNVCYAMANLSDSPQTVQLQATANGMSATRVRLTRIGSERREALATAVALPSDVSVKLKPWELLCIEQTAVK